MGHLRRLRRRHQRELEQAKKGMDIIYCGPEELEIIINVDEAKRRFKKNGNKPIKIATARVV